MIVHGKVWGNTSPVYNKNNTEVHVLEINKGGFCSTHHHAHKFNKFIVISGSIKVCITKDYGKPTSKNWTVSYSDVFKLTEPAETTNFHVDETILDAGKEITVAPGELHSFEALEDSLVLEIYWVELSTDDIIRKNHGGVRSINSSSLS